jgi:ADP-ribose pyrophosphatase YjhB (NUDIX family)
MRRVCAQCGEIAYHNPQVLVSTIVALSDRVLLCRRALAPEVGRWVLPGGFMESNETLEEAAARETREETGVHLNPRELRLYAVASLPRISEVYVGFLAIVAAEPKLICDAECIEAGFFGEADLPWKELAYPDIGVYLRLYFSERRAGTRVIHFGCIEDARVVDTFYRIADVEAECRPRPTWATAPDGDAP